MPPNVDLGSLIAGNQATPMNQMGTVSPRQFSTGQAEISPRPPVDANDKQAREAGWRAYLADPRVKAGLLQMGVNFLSGMSAGGAIGGGLAAIGRADTAQAEEAAAAEAQAMRERQLELQERGVANQERRTDIAEKGLEARRGLAGKGGAKTDKDKLGFKGWLELFQEQNGPLSDNPKSVAEIADMARYYAAVENAGGSVKTFGTMYDRNPDLAWGLLNDWVKDPKNFSTSSATPAEVPEGPEGQPSAPPKSSVKRSEAPVQPSVNPPGTMGATSGSPTLQTVLQQLSGKTDGQSIKNVLGRAIAEGWVPQETELRTLEALGPQVKQQVQALRGKLNK